MSKAVVILGGGGSSKVLNKETIARLKIGSKNFKEVKNRYKFIIVSDAFIGWKMYDYLVNVKQISGRHVIVEDKALDTFQNRDYVKTICSTHHITEILLVTSDYHMPVAKLLFHLTTSLKVVTSSAKPPCKPRVSRRIFYYLIYPIYARLDPNGKKWLARKVQKKRAEWL